MVESAPPTDKVKPPPVGEKDSAAADLAANTWSAMDSTSGRPELKAAPATELEIGNYAFFKSNGGDVKAPAKPADAVLPQSLDLTVPIHRSVAGDATPVKVGDRLPDAQSDAVETKSPEQKMFDPSVKPEDKVKIAEELASQGKTHITGPDGKTKYSITSEKTANGRNQIAIFADSDGKHPILRGVVNSDGAVSKQFGPNGKEADFIGDWVKKHHPDDPMIKKEAPKTTVVPVEQPQTVPNPGREVVPGPGSDPRIESPAVRRLEPDVQQQRPPQDRPALWRDIQPRMQVPRQREAPGRGEYPRYPGSERSRYGNDRPDLSPPAGDGQARLPAYDRPAVPADKPPEVSGDKPPTGEVKPSTGDVKPSVTPGDVQQNATPADNVRPNAGPEGKPPSPTMADSDFEYLRKNFKGLDQDNNDYVTRDEVDKFMETNKGKLNDAETNTLTKFKENIGKLESIHDDEMGIENDGVTRADLNDGEKRMKAYEFAEKNFDKMDGDGDGFVTQDEATKFGKNNEASLSAADKAALDYLKNNVSDLEGHSDDEFGIENDGFTRKDIVQARKDDGSESFRTRKPSDADQLRLPDYKARAPENAGFVSTEDFKTEALRLFDTIDGDKDGHLSTKELADAVQSDKYIGKDAHVVAALYAGRDDLEELSDDEIGDENDGPTKKDIEAFETLRKNDAERRKEVSDVSTWLHDGERFKTLDKDGDKYLSFSEINEALKQPDLSEKDKTNLEFLKKNYSDLEDAHDDETGPENDGITRADLDYFGDSRVATVTNALVTTYSAQNGSRELFGDRPNALDAIKPDAIKQGMIGDCYFESAVASLAATNPEQIKNMITDNHDGTYTVTFPGDKNQPITVDAPTDAEKGLFNRGGSHGVWANVLEKAYGKYCVENPSHRSIFNLGGGNTLSEGADAGEFFHGRAMSLLTGKGYDGDSLMFTSTSTLRAKLTDALVGDNKRPVIAGINNGFGNTDDGFYKAHMYSITAFDPSGPDGGTVTVRNPWGGADDSTRGTKRISLKQLQSNFSSVIFTEK